MKALTTHAEISEDGTIRLELPSGLPPGPADVVLVIQPQAPPSGPAKARSGIFAGKSVEGFDVDAALEEMNALWQAKLGLTP